MRLLLFFLVFTALFSACEKEGLESTTETVAAESVEIVDGVAVSFVDGLARFESYDAATAAEDYFLSLPNDDVHPFSFPSDFRSAHQLFESLGEEDFKEESIPTTFRHVAYLLEEDGDKYLEPIINNSMLKHLANANAQLVIADKLLTIRLDQVVTIPFTDFVEYGEQPEQSPNAIVQPISRNILSLQKGNLDVCTADYSPKRRVRGEVEENTGFLGSTQTCNYRVKTKLLRGGFGGIYYPKEADRIIRHRGDFFQDQSVGIAVFEQNFNQKTLNTLVLNNVPCSTPAFRVNHYAETGTGNNNCDTQY